MCSLDLMTDFAPAERLPLDQIQRQAAALAGGSISTALFNSMLNVVLILNAQRQIVFANRNTLKIVQADDLECLLGLRPGEALGCSHSHERAAGCGTSAFCSECGAVRAIGAALDGRREIQECHIIRILRDQQEALDLQVYGSPFEFQGERFCIFAMTDISHEKRRQVLERIFFHDIIDYASGVAGLVELINERIPEDLRGDMDLVQGSMHNLLDEIMAQKQLAAAESHELKPVFEPIETGPMLENLISIYRRHAVATERLLRIAPDSAGTALISDVTLIKRVIGNLIKNALEAAKPGEEVTVGCEETADTVRFWVHNLAVMPREVQLQVFQRSFTTKGTGRGLGTYSVRLLTECYLKGRADFVSAPETGTRFNVMLPRRPEHLSNS
jgi:signal transduction histidine kinase